MIPTPLEKGFTVYGAKYCGFCKKAKKWCHDNDLTYMYVNIYDFIDDNSKLFENFENKIGSHRTIPLIFKDGQFIGGWSDLNDSLEKKLKMCDEF
jgi:glutaredoxin